MTADGKLYGFGRNQNGQLGLGTDLDQLTPTLIEALKVNLASCACSAYLVQAVPPLFDSSMHRAYEATCQTLTNKNSCYTKLCCQGIR